MPRSYARIRTSAWRDDDFTALPRSAQGLYWQIVAQPDMSLAGVVPFMPARWANFSADDDCAQDLAELEQGRFVVVDRDTGEAWVRTFVKHDGVLDNVKTRRGMWSAWESILSPKIRGAFVDQVEDKRINEAIEEEWVSQAEIEAASEHPQDDPSDGVSDGLSHDLSDGVSDGRSSPYPYPEPKPKPQPEPQPPRAEDGLPTRTPSDSTYSKAVKEWAEATGYGTPNGSTVPDNYRWVLNVVRSNLDDGPTRRRCEETVVVEMVRRIDGEQPDPQTVRTLQRFINSRGAPTALRTIAEALERGAGTGEHAKDKRSIVHYAMKIADEERRAS